jgi:hypothetical protein
VHGLYGFNAMLRPLSPAEPTLLELLFGQNLPGIYEQLIFPYGTLTLQKMADTGLLFLQNQYFTKDEPTPKRAPKTRVRAYARTLVFGLFQVFRDLLRIGIEL